MAGAPRSPEKCTQSWRGKPGLMAQQVATVTRSGRRRSRLGKIGHVVAHRWFVQSAAPHGAAGALAAAVKDFGDREITNCVADVTRQLRSASAQNIGPTSSATRVLHTASATPGHLPVGLTSAAR